MFGLANGAQAAPRLVAPPARNGLAIGTISRIPITLDWSWFLIFGLLTWTLAAGFFPDEYPALAPVAYWLLGGATALLFCASVLLHELGHALLAQREGLPVRGIRLFIFGGVAELGHEPKTPGAEFRITIAGPLVSLALAAGFGALWFLDQQFPTLAAPSIWLARINLSLALFNLIPGFPLDGGRLLRALIWRLTGDNTRATRVAVFSGQLIAFGFIAFGIYQVFSGAVFNGLWLAFIGWFLQNAAATSATQAAIDTLLRGVTVGQAMGRSAAQVPPTLSVERLVAERILLDGQRSFVVVEDDRPTGLVTLQDIASIPAERREALTVGEVMRHWPQVITAEPQAPLLEALQAMDDADVAQMPVVRPDGTLVGLLSREQVIHYLRLRPVRPG